MLLNSKVQNTFTPVTNFSSNRSQITNQIRGKRNENIPMKLKLQKEFNIPVKQVTFMDFVDICFPGSEGYFCIFQKTEKVHRNTFYTKDEMENKIVNFFNKTWGMNCYVSYSSYFSKQRKYETKEIKYKLKNGETVYSEACNLQTKEVFRVKEKKWKPLRTQSNVVKTYLLAQDLDFYKLGMSFETAISIISRLIREGKIICPTMLIFTGQGIQLIWAVKPFKNIAGYTHDREWRKIQETMYDIFEKEGLNPDTVVKNASAVTRAAETVNRKSQSLVHAFYMNDANLLLSDFLFLYDINPYADRLVKPKKGTSSKKETSNKQGDSLAAFVPNNRNTENWNEFSLNRNREEDLFIFVKTMNKRGNAQHYIGMRNWLCLVLRFHSLVSSEGDKIYAVERTKSLIKLMDLSDTDENELMNRSDLAEKYYDEWINNTWDKEKYVRGGLFYTNKTMLELMKIEKDYEIQWKMKTIKSRTHKYKKETKKLREAEKTGKDSKLDKEVIEAIEASRAYDAYRKRVENYGVIEADNHTWEAYQERRKEVWEETTDNRLTELEKALEENPGIKNGELAKLMGISIPYVKKLKRKLNGKN